MYERLYETFITRKSWSFYLIRRHTNDLNTEISPELIAKSIVDLATTFKVNPRDVSVSNIKARGDNDNLNEKDVR